MANTEREQKLMDYIAYLFGAINLYQKSLEELIRLITWNSENLRSFDFPNKIKEIITICNTEYNWDAKVGSSLEKIEEEVKQ